MELTKSANVCDNKDSTNLDFSKIRETVYDAINRIDLIDDKNKARKVLRAFDYYLFLKKDVTTLFNAQCVTNAWLKCYEILSYFKFGEKDSPAIARTLLTPGHDFETKEITAFFNAELPGAFIAATNHYAKMQLQKQLKWKASSLYGTDYNLGDTYGVYKNNPNNWLMGPKTHNGDLTSPDIILKIRRQIFDTFPKGVDLYTADGGIGVDEEYEKQEEINAKLNLGQVLCGLLTLADHGTLITKQYMFTYDFTISLIVILSYLFKSLYITKPATSRPVNSEIYIVGIGFRSDRLTKKLEEHLIAALANFNFQMPLIPMSCVDSETLESIYKAAKYIHAESQVEAVNEVVDAYFDKTMSEIYNTSKIKYRTAAADYLKRYPIKKIPDSDKLKAVRNIREIQHRI